MKIREAAAALGEWVKAHPRFTERAGIFLAGLVIGIALKWML